METVNIVAGSRVKILPNLPVVLKSLGFESDAITRVLKFVNTEQKALALWSDSGQEYVTIDLCVEIPVQCLEVLT